MSADDLGFEPLDEELGRRLRSAAPEAGNAQAALDALRPQLARARTRRRTVVGTASLAGLAVVGTLGVVALGGGPSGEVRTPPATRPTVTTVPAPSVPTTVPDPTAPGGITPTSDDRGGNSGPGGGGDSGSGSGSGSNGND